MHETEGPPPPSLTHCQCIIVTYLCLNWWLLFLDNVTMYIFSETEALNIDNTFFCVIIYMLQQKISTSGLLVYGGSLLFRQITYIVATC